jgi:rieske iron-sulfur protein
MCDANCPSTSEQLRRRAVLKGVMGLGAGLAVAAIRAGAQDALSARPRAGDRLVQVGDAKLKPLVPDDLLRGNAPTLAWPLALEDRLPRDGSRLNRILLVRLDPAALSDETRARGVQGVVAYTAICPHTGCDVNEWLADDQLLRCPCHFSAFNPKYGGRVVEGPAARSLPALPLTVADGQLVVAAPFLTRVGFEAS